MSDYYFFWKGQLSQWATSPFDAEGQKFLCVEQYMMWKKAMLFGDATRAREILTAHHPRVQKALGRRVNNFDEATWDAHKFDIVTEGNMHKYMQNPNFLDKLRSTGSKTIAEATPFDRVWGIGLTEDDPRARDESQWLGENLLGKALMVVRETLGKQG